MRQCIFILLAVFALYMGSDGLAHSSFDGSAGLKSITSQPFSSGKRYDADSRLTGKSRAWLEYDVDGNRKASYAGGASKNFLIDDRNPTGYAQTLVEYENSPLNPPSRRYTLGLDLGAHSRKTGTVQSPSYETDYYGYDGHGSVRFLFDDQTGWETQVSDTYDYDAYGILIRHQVQDANGSLVDVSESPGTATPNNYLYTGEYWDEDLDLYYLRARWYHPELGRFTTMDTYEGSRMAPASLHKYLYANADPINGVDPSGMATEGMGGLTASMNLMSGVASQGAGAITRAYVHTLVRLPQIMDAGQRVLLWTEFIGGLAGVAAFVGPEVIEAAANVAERVDQAFAQNSQGVSAGWATRGRQIEAMAGLAIEQDGGKFLGGNVRGIDGQLAVTKGDVLVSLRSHNLSADKLLGAIQRDLESLSKADQQFLSGRTHDGNAFERRAGPSAGRIATIAVPESQARHIVSPEFIEKMRQFAQQTKTIPIVRSVRGFR